MIGKVPNRESNWRAEILGMATSRFLYVTYGNSSKIENSGNCRSRQKILPLPLSNCQIGRGLAMSLSRSRMGQLSNG